MSGAVAHLREWLATEDPELNDRLSVQEWERLAYAPIALTAELRIKVPIGDGESLEVPRRAHLQRVPDFLFAFADDEAMADSDVMGPHLALLFGAEGREKNSLSHGWHQAISRVDRGIELRDVRISDPAGATAEATSEASAQDIASEGPSPTSDAQPADVTPTAASTSATNERPTAAPDLHRNNERLTTNERPTTNDLAPSQELRDARSSSCCATAGDPARLAIRRPCAGCRHPLGEIEVVPTWITPENPGLSTSESRLKVEKAVVLRAPDISRTDNGAGATSNVRPASRSYARNDPEREDLGMKLVCRELKRLLGAELKDVRKQDNVGADAIDQHGVYYELKVHAGALLDSETLTRSEFQRAEEEGENYVLVLVGGLEQGATPVLRMIRDPLNTLRRSPVKDVQVSGILKCMAG